MLFKFIAKILYSIVLVIEVILSLRFIFSLIGIKFNDVSKDNVFVYYIFEWSNTILKPIAQWHLPNIPIGGNYHLDLTVTVGIIIFMIIAYALVEIIKAFE